MRMSNKRLLFTGLLTLYFSLNALAEMTLIQGNAFYYRGKPIEVHRYLDLFTFESEPVGQGEIPGDGSFRFEIDIPEVGLYLIKIGKVNAHLFIEPGEEYTLVIPEPQEMDRFSPAKDVFVLPEVFEAQSKLNYYITELEKDLNRFTIEHTYLLPTPGQLRRTADSVITTIEQEYQKVEIPYFKAYFHWRMAEFEITTVHTPRSVYKKYFATESPAFDQLSFSHAFAMLYEGYMNPHSVRKFNDSLQSAIARADYESALGWLSSDPLLQREDYRNLVFATELYELGRKREYPLGTVLALTDSVIMNVSEPEIIEIAKNARNLLIYLAPGTPAPDFTFADVVGNHYRISEYKGRHIYVQFFTKFTPETLREMSLMKVLKEGYGTDIAMFSLSTEESLRSLRETSEKHDFDWFFGKLMMPESTVDAYDLRAMPAYFLFDEELNLMQSPAPPPGSRIERTFAKLWEAKHPNKGMPFKLQPPPVDEEDGANAP